MKESIKIGSVAGPYSPGIIASGKKMIFVSGQVATNRESDITGQTKEVLDKIKAVLAEAGASMAELVKTTVFLADIKDFSAMNEVYAKYFTDSDPPARATFQVGALPFNLKVEIEGIAVLD